MATKHKKWSYSRFSMFQKCPAQYHWHYIKKMPRLPSKALDNGLRIHKLAEDYVKGKIKRLPKELDNFEDEFKSLKKLYKQEKGFTEPDISITESLESSKMEDTDWFIGFADFILFNDDEIVLIDYKTGRYYPSHQEQGHAYAMALMALNPDVENVYVEFWYLDNGNVKEYSFTRSEYKAMLKVWQTRINRMYKEHHKMIKTKKAEATPNKFCKWCARHKKHGGDCDG